MKAPAPPRSPLVAAVVALVGVVAACSPAAEPAPPSGGGGGEGGGGATAALADVGGDLLAAFDVDGALVLLDPVDASLVARRELALFGVATDLLVDVDRARLVVALEQDEDTRFVEVPLQGADLGAPRQLAKVTGRARIALLPQGLLVASDADGPRVRLLRHDGSPSPGRGLPPPRSWWWDEGAGQVVGLALPAGEDAMRFALRADPDGRLEIADVSLGPRPDDGRLVAAEGAEWLVALDRDAGAIQLAELDPARPAEPRSSRRLVGAGAEVEGAIGWPPGRIVIATNQPTSLVVADLVAEEEVAIVLPDPVPSGSPYGRRDLAVVGGAFFAATHAGVVALQRDEGSVTKVRVDLDFDGADLRGPLASVPAPAP